VPYSSVAPPYGLTLSVGPLYENWAWSRPYLPKG
jgi:hypothetical protein